MVRKYAKEAVVFVTGADTGEAAPSMTKLSDEWIVPDYQRLGNNSRIIVKCLLHGPAGDVS